MKLCFSTLACPTWTLKQIIDAAVAVGIPGIDFRGLGAEIDLTRVTEFDTHLDQTLAALTAANLVMPCLNTSVTLVSPPERWETMLDEATRYARLAGRTGTAFLRIFGGAVPKEMTRDEGRNLAQRHLRQVSKVCRAHNCIPVLETHDAWVTAEEVMQILDGFAPDEAGALWDIEHPHRRGQAPADVITGLGSFLKHVHVKDSRRQGEKNIPMLLGEGDLPLPSLVGALKDARYGGWLCLETEKRWHAAAPEPEQSIPQFAAYARTHWL